MGVGWYDCLKMAFAVEDDEGMRSLVIYMYACMFDNRENRIEDKVVDYCLALSNCCSFFLVQV